MSRCLSFISSIICLVLLSSCAKDPSRESTKAFIGTYQASVVERVVWGSDSKTLNSNGVIIIEKTSPTTVRISGLINAQANIVGTMMYIQGGSVADAAGYYTCSYTPAFIVDNILTIERTHIGQLMSNGKFYDYQNIASFTAIKID